MKPSFMFASGGNTVGNGGDAIAIEFIQVALHGVNYVESIYLSDNDIFILNQIKEAIESTQIETKDHLFIVDREVDAINYPTTKVIEVSRSRWRKVVEENIKTQILLTFHEYLGILGYDDFNYSISLRLVDKSIFPPLNFSQSKNYFWVSYPTVEIVKKNDELLHLKLNYLGDENAVFECEMNRLPIPNCTRELILTNPPLTVNNITIRATSSDGRISFTEIVTWVSLSFKKGEAKL